MKTGYYIPMSLNHRLFLIWSIIILSFDRIIFYELNKEFNWFLTILAIVSIICFMVSVWPCRFFIVDTKLYFNTFSRIQMKIIDLRYISSIKITNFGFKFSYAGDYYHFFTFGKSKRILSELQDLMNNFGKENDVKSYEKEK